MFEITQHLFIFGFRLINKLLAFHLALCRAGDVVWERQAAEDSWIIDNIAEVDNM